MRLVVNGTAVHTENDPSLSISRQGLYTEDGVIYGIENTWTIQGRLEGDTQAEISTEINTLESVYAQKIDRIALTLDNGDDSSHVLSSGDTLSGIRVIQPPHYPEGSGAEYATFRNYSVVVQAIIKPSPLLTQAAVVQFSESVTFRGGGSRDVILTPLIGFPVRFQTAQQTPTFATQQGNIISLDRHVLNVAPLWPALEFRHLRTFSFGEPLERNAFGKDHLFPTSWRFEFGAVRGIAKRGPSTVFG